MLDYAAGKFYKLSQVLTTVGLDYKRLLSTKEGKALLQRNLSELADYGVKLGLTLSVNQIDAVWRAASVYGAGDSTASSELAQLQKRIFEELDARKFFCIPQDKTIYAQLSWLLDSPIFDYDDVFEEFQSAGRCYAYGEDTACVFHLMRIVDRGFHMVAESLGIVYDARNWHGIGEKIESQMNEKYKNKSADWKIKEPFYAEILTDIQAIGRGHRNPVLHELAKKYNERDSHYMLVVVEGFMRHVIAKLK